MSEQSLNNTYARNTCDYCYRQVHALNGTLVEPHGAHYYHESCFRTRKFQSFIKVLKRKRCNQTFTLAEMLKESEKEMDNDIQH